MTVPLLRVCYHCGYPTPGRHASSCRDADSGVVEVAKPPVPAQVAQQIRDIEAQRDGLAELLKGAVEAGEMLRQELDEARAERDRLGAELAVTERQWRGAVAERDRMRPVVEAAEAYVTARRALDGHTPEMAVDLGVLADAQYEADLSLATAVDAYRSATPDAEPAPRAEACPECGPGYRYGDEGCRHTPAPGVPVDTEATP